MQRDDTKARRRAARRWFRPTLEVLEERTVPSITVNTLVDEADGSIVDGDISLRDAIAASPAGGVINFSVTGTINLSLGEVFVQDRILEGPGAAQLTINANQLSGVLRTRGTTTISGMTITGGGASYGGGILHEAFYEDPGPGHLTVRDCVITGNTAFKGGGINCGGYTELAFTQPHVTVVNSTISGNTALEAGIFNTGLGGGIYNGFSYLTIDKSTISGNIAMGKARYRSGLGGGIYSHHSTTITNSTISGNTAPRGGGIWGDGLTTISNSTISGNGGTYGLYLRNGVVANSTNTGNFNGIRSDPRVTLTNSIVAGNNAGDIVGTVDAAASRNNLIGSKGAGGLTNGVNGNLVGFAEPGLGPLANNGGPTQTHALWSFSPAINAGDNSLVPIDPFTGLPLPFTTDQTGAPRIFNGGTIDMGAVELQGTVLPSLVVNTATDDVAVNALTSLREAVGFARTLGGVVTFDPAVFATPQTIALVHGQILVGGASVSVTIAGPGADLATVDAGGASRVFKTFGTTTISGLTITGGAVEENESRTEGAIFNDKGNTLTVQDSLITGNETNGILNRGTLTVSNSTISDNTAIGSGGGIYSYIEVDDEDSLFATISNSIIDGNVATSTIGRGGGIFANGTLTISNSTISGNSTILRGAGGGIFANGTLTISNSTISGNSTGGNGGGIHGSDLTIINSTISGNSASIGGGILGSGTIINSTISGNSAGAGGGIAIFDSLTRITNSTIANNTATDLNGGLYGSGSPTIVNSIVAGNRLNGTPSDVGNSLNPASAYNLIGDAATAGGLVNGVNGNIVGVDPALVFGPLADNGGPTPTHALLPGSPALNAGDPAFDPNAFTPPLMNDQRGSGFTRVRGGTVDVGAFEVQDDLPTIGSHGTTVTVNEGTQATNTGTFDDTQGRGTVTLTASLGTVTKNDAAGTWSWSYTPPDGPSPTTVTVTATDDLGMTATTTFTLAVDNVAPTAAVTGPTGGTPGQARTFTVSATDPSSVDQAAGFVYAITWGDGSATQTIDRTDGNGAGVSVDHAFAAAGTYTVTVTATDKDDGTSTSATHIITIAAAVPTVSLQPDPLDSTKTALVVNGTDGPDTAIVIQAGATNQVTVMIGGQTVGTFAPTGRVLIYGNGGNDVLALSTLTSFSLPAWVFGGAGDDFLVGGAWHDVLVGGDGNDAMMGGRGRDLLIAGRGADALNGHFGEDVLIAGLTSHDADLVALDAIMAEWTSARSFATRVANLSGTGSGPRANGDVFLKASGAGATVFDDGAVDQVADAFGPDWIFVKTRGPGVLDVLTTVSFDSRLEELGITVS